MNKTVYVLGAGFSMALGAPSQGAIIRNIFELRNSKSFTVNRKRQVNRWIDQFEDFIKNTLYISEEQKLYIPLEDVFTPIDRCISDNIAFRNISVTKLTGLRSKFYNLIILAIRETIHNSTNNDDNKKLLSKFSNEILNNARRKSSDEKDDRVSIITTNWDILLDNSLHFLIKKEPKKKTDKFAGVVDYCCYISSLDQKDESIKPGLYAIGKNKFNVKILKLHGSLNWLQCPRCQRLYVKYYRKWNGGYVFSEKYCRHCEENYNIKKADEIILKSNLVMPTFLKDLGNFQIKLIWQNAGIELSEATKVVFIGYSLPFADFEFRQLLSRMIRKDAEIEVVLSEVDNPHRYFCEQKYNAPGYRYEVFFSGRKLNIVYNGAKEFINNL
jgi:hypothetical protein